MKKILLVLGMFCFWSSMAWALIPGDISGNGDIGLEEAVHALKVAAGLPSSVAVVPDPQTLVGKTGQMTSYTEGDDGDLERGVTLANPRFTDYSDGTVTDNLTDLIWLKILINVINFR